MSSSTEASYDVAWSTCDVCGKRRQIWYGAHPTTHAKCRVTEAFQDDLLALKEAEPRLTQERMARDLGVSKNTLRAWLLAALERRRRTTVAARPVAS